MLWCPRCKEYVEPEIAGAWSYYDCEPGTTAKHTEGAVFCSECDSEELMTYQERESQLRRQREEAQRSQQQRQLQNTRNTSSSSQCGYCRNSTHNLSQIVRSPDGKQFCSRGCYECYYRNQAVIVKQTPNRQW